MGRLGAELWARSPSPRVSDSESTEWWEQSDSRLGRCVPEGPRDPLGYWSDGAGPCGRGLRQPNCERPHQATVAVPLLEEPHSAQRLPGDPVQHITVYLWPNCFHEVAGETVASRGVEMQHTEAGIEP